MDLHVGEMSDSSRQRVALESRTSTCRANGLGYCCKYGRNSRSVNHGSSRCKSYELNRNVTCRKYQRSSHEFFTLANSRRREDAHKSKFRRRTMPTNVIFLFLMYFLLACEAKNSVKGTSPRLIGDAKKKITATVGETAVLPCKVVAEPQPLTSWKINGEPILGLRQRFKVGSSLRIRDVRTTDAGRYRCTATNALGSVDFDVHLVVRDPEEKMAPSKPRFVMSAKMRRRVLSKPVNSFLRLRCRASGHPNPQIEWYKDGNFTVPPGSKSDRRQPWIYTIRKLQRNDSGQYRCRVWNSEGEIQYTYKVRVVDQLRERPVLLEPHPMNTTVQVGGMTAIQCRVQSRVKPTVKWIKRLDNKEIAEYNGDLPPSVITIENHQYLILPTQEMLSMANGSYLNKLVIRGATEKHAGMYICLAANTMGYNYKYAYLTVVSGPVNTSQRGSSSPRTVLLPGSRSQNKQGSLSLPAIIGVPAGIGLVMVAFLAWFCHRKREENLKGAAANVVVSGSDRLSALGSSETKSSTRSTPVPPDCEQHSDEISKESSHPLVGTMERQTDRNHNAYYSYNHRPPPTAGTPLLTVNEPENSEFQEAQTDDEYYAIPSAPPCSEVASSCLSGTEKRLTFQLGPPPPPPPSQKSLSSSLSSYQDTRSQYSHHYHYMHPPGNSRRHHHSHGHHSRNGHHHYGY